MPFDNNWDPLDSSLSVELASATIKRQIKNILKSYTGWYDPLCELVQNSLDAVDNRRSRGDKFTPSIWITINMSSGTLSVTDNGIGFTQDQFKSFLAPNVSFKGQGDRGNKGVGATYLGYGFNFLQIGTKTPDFQYVGTLKNAREWVEDTAGTLTRPKVQESDLIDGYLKTVDQGSTFSLRLVGRHIRPSNLRWVGATTADQWEAVLRIKTPLGGVYIGRQVPIIGCTLTVVDESGKSSTKALKSCEYIYPHTVISTCVELSDIRKAQAQRIEKGMDASKLPDSLYRLNGLYSTLTHDQLLDMKSGFGTTLSDEEKELVKQHQLQVYGFFCYSTDIWDTYNDNILKLRRDTRILRGGYNLPQTGCHKGSC